MCRSFQRMSTTMTNFFTCPVTLVAISQLTVILRHQRQKEMAGAQKAHSNFLLCCCVCKLPILSFYLSFAVALWVSLLSASILFFCSSFIITDPMITGFLTFPPYLIIQFNLFFSWCLPMFRLSCSVKFVTWHVVWCVVSAVRLVSELHD